MRRWVWAERTLDLLLIENLADPVHATACIGSSDDIIDSAQPEAIEEVGQVLSSILDCDDRLCIQPFLAEPGHLPGEVPSGVFCPIGQPHPVFP
ncbi:MAG: hypothetical protein WBA45_06135 [Microthrixaceae bacterium]